jgi:protoheme ferro-lyase
MKGMVFVKDCLKYMEEIDYENKENFRKNNEKKEERNRKRKKMVHLSLR